MNQKNFKNLLIGKNISRTSNVIPETLKAGEIAVFTESGTLVTASSAPSQTKIRLIQGRGSKPALISDVINKELVRTAKGSVGAAPQSQITYVGYNGTSGELDEANDTTFYVRVQLNEFLLGNGVNCLKHGVYKSPSTGNTQYKTALWLTDSLIKNFSRDAERVVKFERVNSGATVASTGTGAITATYNSNVVVAGTDADAVAVVGDFIRFGTAKTSPVYKIIAISGDNITLDAKYQGESEVFAEVGYEFVKVEGDWGLKMTGLQVRTDVGRFNPYAVRFEVALQEFETAEVTYAQAGNAGNNTAAHIAYDEFVYQGNTGLVYKNGGPNNFPIRAEVEDILYDAIDVQWSEKTEVGALNNISNKELKIAVPNGAAGQVTDATSGIVPVLEAFFGVELL